MQYVITLIEQHGLLVVFLNALLAQGGLPLPVIPILMMTAALASQSAFQILEVVLAAVCGTLIADFVAVLVWSSLWTAFPGPALQALFLARFLCSPHRGSVRANRPLVTHSGKIYSRAFTDISGNGRRHQDVCNHLFVA